MFSRRLALGLLLATGAPAVHAQCVLVNAIDTALSQDFDTLATAGTTNAMGLAGWMLLETGGAARDNELYAADTGSGNTGDVYSYGAAASGERALGSLRSGTLVPSYGVCYTNNTGAAITSLDIAYVGEHWRLGAPGRSDRLDMQYSLDAVDLATGSWIDVDVLDFSTPVTTGTAGPRDGNDAANRTALAATLGSLSIANGATIWLRWSDADVSGADDGLAVDNLAVTARGTGGGGVPVLSIAGTSAAEGDSGTTPFLFTVSLSAPAPAGGVSFDYATSDGTATVAGGDYVAASGTATIEPGATSVTLGVDVLGDLSTEADEAFTVTVSNITGAAGGTVAATGNLLNDDVTLVPISAIQGPGATSPLVGQAVFTRGIVTGRKSNGFFLQTADAAVDADPATSEGLFVFTGTAPAAAAAVGNRVQVSGTVLEYIPAADTGQLPMTELGGTIGITLLDIGHALPTPIVLTTTFPDPAGALDQLEPLEGMRVTAPAFTAVAPTGGTTSEPNATGTTNGIFNVVVAGTARPFREAGIQAPDAPPGGGATPPIPRWDFNPELLTVVSRGLGGAPLDVVAGSTLANLVGPLDYGFRRYTILPDAAQVVAIDGVPAAAAARAPTADEFTVASYNLERFFDSSNDPATDDPVVTPAALATRLGKASLAIRDYLHAPDVLAVVEVENLAVLQALAARIGSDAVAAGQPDPAYSAHLLEGNDVGGIDVGFLVKSGEVAAGVDRVDIDAVLQLGKDLSWTEPAGGSSPLNDRPPLRLDAVVNFANGLRFPITAIAVHQRSLNGAEEDSAAGVRVRAKRQAQAEYLAAQLQALQDADPARNITVLGDFNAFEFNDGFVDAMNVVTGTPSADASTVVPGDGVDLVDPDLLNLFILEPAAQRYSFVFDGNAQSLDHVLVNQALGVAVGGMALDHARINADFPEVARNDAASPSRLSDHDPAIAYFSLASADLAVSASATPAAVPGGGTLSFDAVLANDGPNAASAVGIGFAFDAALPDLAVAAPAGWSCDTPTLTTTTTVVACSTTTLAIGATPAFALTATAPAAKAGQSIRMVALASARTPDPDSADNAASASVEVTSVSNLGVQLAGPTLLTRTSKTATYTASVRYGGPDAPIAPVLALSANAPAAAVSLAPPPAGWSCTVAATATFSATCAGTVGAAPPAIALTIANVGRLRLPAITVRAEVGSESLDADLRDNVATRRTRVLGVYAF